MLSKEEQLAKHEIPIDKIELGRLISINPVLQNAPWLNVVIPCVNVTFINFSHPENEYFPIVVDVEGSITYGSFIQDWKQ